MAAAVVLDPYGVVLLVGASSLVALLPVLLQRLPEMFDDVCSALATVDEGYAKFLDAGREDALAPAGVALRRLVWSAQLSLQARADGRDVDVPAAAEGAGPTGDGLIWQMFEELGREQCRRSLPLQNLLAAYQAGGRAAWRYIGDVAVAGGLSGEALSALADQVFCLVDELVSVTLAGYVDEQGRGHDQQERAREELVARLLSVPPDRDGVVAAARRAGWRLPADAAVVLFRAGEPARLTGLGSHLPIRQAELPGVIVPDASAPGARQRLTAALRGTSALVGPVVPPERLGTSARLTELAARTLEAPESEDGGVVFVDDHLDVLIVHRDPHLLAALRGRCLAPLLDVPPASREALQRTLRAWLRHMGNRTAMATELGIHPQTVRYRLGRLRELFGTALDDPDFRLCLALTVGWEPPPPPGGTASPAPRRVAAAGGPAPVAAATGVAQRPQRTRAGRA